MILVYSFFLYLFYDWNFQLLRLLVEKRWGVNYQSWDNFHQNEGMIMYIKAAVVNATIEGLQEKVKNWWAFVSFCIAFLNLLSCIPFLPALSHSLVGFPSMLSSSFIVCFLIFIFWFAIYHHLYIVIFSSLPSLDMLPITTPTLPFLSVACL